MSLDSSGASARANGDEADFVPVAPPGDLTALLLIAQRGAVEALRDRMTVVMSLLFSLAIPLFLSLAVARPIVRAIGDSSSGGDPAAILAVFLLMVGLIPSAAAVGIASGQFVGEKEQGSLQPLLVSPASNGAIFGGKVLGSIIPPLLFAAFAEVVFVGGIVATTGSAGLRELPGVLLLAIIGFVPGATLFAATLASLISSRVRTYNAAQQIGGFALVPVWGVVFTLSTRMVTWGPAPLLGTVLGIFILDVILLRLAAATWRREEVLAQN